MIEMTEQEWLECDFPQRMLGHITIGDSTKRKRKMRLLAVALEHHRLLDRGRDLSTCLLYDAIEGVHGCPKHWKDLFAHPIKWVQRSLLSCQAEGCEWQCNAFRDVFNPFQRVTLPPGTPPRHKLWPCKVCEVMGRRKGQHCTICRGEQVIWALCGECFDDGAVYQIGGLAVPCIHCPRAVSPWLTPAVQGIAETIYNTRDFSGMPVLADALEEAGCDNWDMLSHCRGLQRCSVCLGIGVHPAFEFNPPLSRPVQVKEKCKVCDGSGCVPTKGEHIRGCWVIDLLLGKE